MLKTLTLALAAAAIAVPVYTVPASATDYWDWEVGSGNPTARHKKARTRYAKRQQRKQEPTKVMAFVKREGEDKTAGTFTCADRVRGLGTQWIGTEGALDAAKKDWMERVRYDYGEAFLDLTNSQDFVSRCGRTSIGETMGQVMYRCEIVARPCKGAMEAKAPAVK